MPAFLRLYRMTAHESEGPALRAALETLAAQVQRIEGCEGTELLQDCDKPDQFVLLERWTSAEAHKAGGKLLGKEAFAPVMAALAGPPEAASLNALG
ncbi:antibiotic biosynthesis monooxygenase family protein [Novosphingobium sp. MMS21-SN21R]|uniref:putative quinol monooxygenase n=1 Tax=Novosphingobium sp. MMS21-SN21R TaxID=2969298 RepID=UPI0028881F75|nr:antibiotic biosynthesis monooxygenase family protein [Novosphingobium sp. MMS21-SN21R]MDT0509723.1 antibiotic biosynthesis monooxygenase family protein [Novosphingobium sp. MMS21-SN21R]